MVPSYLEPSSRLRRWFQRILKSAVEIISLSTGVACAIGLATRLDPDNAVDIFIASVRGRTHAKAGVDDIAPVALLNLGRGLDATSACRQKSTKD